MEAEEYMHRGELVPDELVIAMIEAELKGCPNGFVMDGFPRTVAQAQALDAMLERRGWKLDAAMLFSADRPTLIERLASRWTNPRTGRIYNVLTNPPKVAGICDEDGGELIQRDDDSAETVATRLDVYDAQTRAADRVLSEDREARRSRRARKRRGGREADRFGRRRGSDAGSAMVTLKSPREIEMMRRSGKITARVLTGLMKTARPGMTTGELDALAERGIREAGGTPTFKGYNGFPASICASVNDEVVHGIPGSRVLRDGDLLSIDIGTTLDGYVSDSAVTVPVGNISATGAAPARGDAGVSDGRDRADAARQARRRYRCGRASARRSHGYGVVRELVGHGVGRAMHEEPQVPNYGEPATGMELRAGLGAGGRADDHAGESAGPDPRRRLDSRHGRW